MGDNFYPVQDQINDMGDELGAVQERIETVIEDMETVAARVKNLHLDEQLLKRTVAHFCDQHSSTATNQEGMPHKIMAELRRMKTSMVGMKNEIEGVRNTNIKILQANRKENRESSANVDAKLRSLAVQILIKKRERPESKLWREGSFEESGYNIRTITVDNTCILDTDENQTGDD